MPLIIISGLPASGKSRRATQLKDFFQSKGKTVHVLSENVAIPKAGYTKNDYFGDSQKEKIVRSGLKSETVRILNKTDVTILDAGNYIKGYRYELFCASKASRGTQCTLFCAIKNDDAWKFNTERTAEDVVTVGDVPKSELNNSNVPYAREIFDALCIRFEEPQSNNRWDSPLFVAFPSDDLNLDSIYSALYEAKSLPPNQSTQNPPLGSTNYLFEMDVITQIIVKEILNSHKVGIYAPLRIKDSDVPVQVTQSMNPMYLNRLRRQFISYNKTHHSTIGGLDRIPQLFVQYINANNKPTKN